MLCLHPPSTRLPKPVYSRLTLGSDRLLSKLRRWRKGMRRERVKAIRRLARRLCLVPDQVLRVGVREPRLRPARPTAVSHGGVHAQHPQRDPHSTRPRGLASARQATHLVAGYTRDEEESATGPAGSRDSTQQATSRPPVMAAANCESACDDFHRTAAIPARAQHSEARLLVIWSRTSWSLWRAHGAQGCSPSSAWRQRPPFRARRAAGATPLAHCLCGSRRHCPRRDRQPCCAALTARRRQRLRVSQTRPPGDTGTA